MKSKFIFFNNFKTTADKLPDELRLKFYDAMTDYVFKDIEPEDPVISALVSAIRPSLDKEEKRGGNNNPLGQNQYKDVKTGQNRSKQVKEKNQEDKKKELPTEIGQTVQSFLETGSNKQEDTPKDDKSSSTPFREDDEIIDIEELIAKTPKRNTFKKPTLDEVKGYIAEKNLCVDPEKFMSYFEAGNWKDSEGKQVKSWKQKLITWDDQGRKRRTIDAARGLLAGAVKSDTYGKDTPL